MECCVCYKNIKQSHITCHNLCKQCCDKIHNRKCPMCRNEMKIKNIFNGVTVEVTYEYGGKKDILLKNLNRFVFSKQYKKYLENILSRWCVSYKKDFVIIDYKKYDYDEILDFNTYSKYMSLAGNQYYSNNCNFMYLIDKIIDRQNINRLNKKDIFYIRNVINRYEYENYKTRLLQYVWGKEMNNIKFL